IIAGADIRYHGSRNVGATNVARNFGKVPGIVALLLDIAKGYAAVAAARWIVERADWPLVADAAHTSPLYSMSMWVALAGLIAVAIILKHHSNIARMAQGTERRMGGRKEP